MTEAPDGYCANWTSEAMIQGLGNHWSDSVEASRLCRHFGFRRSVRNCHQDIIIQPLSSHDSHIHFWGLLNPQQVLNWSTQIRRYAFTPRRCLIDDFNSKSPLVGLWTYRLEHLQTRTLRPPTVYKDLLQQKREFLKFLLQQLGMPSQEKLWKSTSKKPIPNWVAGKIPPIMNP